MQNREESLLLQETALAKKQPRLFVQILIFLLVFLVAQGAVGLISGIPTTLWAISEIVPQAAAGENIDPAAVTQSLMADMPAWLMFVSLLAAGMQIPVSIIYCRYAEGRSLRSMGMVKKGFWKEYGKGFGIGSLMLLASGGLCALSGSMSFRFNPQAAWGWLLLFLLGFVLQGAGEEFLCRGYFMLSLTNRVSRAWAVAISSVFFALLHIANAGLTLLALLNLALFGVFAGLYMLRRDDIWGVCGIHSAWNYVQGNILGVEVSGMGVEASLCRASVVSGRDWLHGGAFGLEGGLAVTAVLLAAILLTLLLPRKAAA